MPATPTRASDAAHPEPHDRSRHAPCRARSRRRAGPYRVPPRSAACSAASSYLGERSCPSASAAARRRHDVGGPLLTPSAIDNPLFYVFNRSSRMPDSRNRSPTSARKRRRPHPLRAPTRSFGVLPAAVGSTSRRTPLSSRLARSSSRGSERASHTSTSPARIGRQSSTSREQIRRSLGDLARRQRARPRTPASASYRLRQPTTSRPSAVKRVRDGLPWRTQLAFASACTDEDSMSLAWMLVRLL